MPHRHASSSERVRRRALVATSAAVGVAASVTFAYAALLTWMADLPPGVLWAASLVAVRPLVVRPLRPALGERASSVISFTWCLLAPWLIASTLATGLEVPLVGSVETTAARALGAETLVVAALVAAYAITCMWMVIALDARRATARRRVGWVLGAAAVASAIAIAGGLRRSAEMAPPSQYAARLREVSPGAEVAAAPRTGLRGPRIEDARGFEQRTAVASTGLEATRTCDDLGCRVSLAPAGGSSSGAVADNVIALPYLGQLILHRDDLNGHWTLFADGRPIAAYRFDSLALTDVTPTRIAGSLAPERGWIAAAAAGLVLAAVALWRRRNLLRLRALVGRGRDAVVGPAGWIALSGDGRTCRVAPAGEGWPDGARVVVLSPPRAGGYRGTRERWVPVMRGATRSLGASLASRADALSTAALSALLLLSGPLFAAVLAGLVF